MTDILHILFFLNLYKTAFKVRRHCTTLPLRVNQCTAQDDADNDGDDDNDDDKEDGDDNIDAAEGKNNTTHLEVLQAGVHLGKELRVATEKINLKVHEKNHFARGSHQQLNIVESTSSSLMTHCWVGKRLQFKQ